MLDKRLKWAFFLLALVFAGLPIGGIILDVLRPSQIEVEQSSGKTVVDPSIIAAAQKEDMVRIPPGLFLRGYNEGGFDEKPERQIMLDAYWIDRFEVTYGNYLALCRRRDIASQFLATSSILKN